ncbi:mitotic checkpoint regulator, MAD2B-interacting-domain-containing protein [Pisolithus tinctorius]|nr:mitotic checkpoint regulator, MAD2B-interacting-domain-containing protein [Pisolithus tinctorius]
MLGIEEYGSDIDSDDDSRQVPTQPPPKPSPPQPAPSAKPKRPKKILAINLPPPRNDDDDDDEPPAKKPRITTSSGQGAGRSSLLGMLPAPKQALPVKEKKEERVLGGGGGRGLVFRTTKPAEQQSADEAAAESETGATDDTSTLFLPPSISKGKANVSLDSDGPQKVASSSKRLPAPAQTFFSLGSASTSTRTTPSSAPSLTAVSSAPSTSTSSAPAIPTFRPPSPTLDDPYPGYYQLPSGAYAPYDADYYASYARKWQAEYDKQIRELEKSQYNLQTEDVQDVDMAAEMEKARREIQVREERKALTAGKANNNADGEPEMPKMNVKGAKLGSVARSRHQLTTLLTEAYLNREALEEKIAQARRNRKEAGNKYGF